MLMTSAFEKLNSIYCLCFCSGNVKMSVTAIIISLSHDCTQMGDHTGINCEDFA